MEVAVTGYRRAITNENASLPNGVSTAFGYDNADRLTSVVNSQTGPTTMSTYTYTLDAVGNRISDDWDRRTTEPTSTSAKPLEAGDSGGATATSTYNEEGLRMSHTVGSSSLQS
jgi:YD repeat-containing protein